MEQWITDYFPEFTHTYPPELVLGVSIVLVLMLLVLFSLWYQKLRYGIKAHKGLVIQSYQLAPLGRDAFLKLQNPGAPVTLLQVTLTGRDDVLLKNTVSGHQLDLGQTYSLLLEATGDRRLGHDFQVYITFIDEQRRSYQQHFSLQPVASLMLKRISR